MRTVWMSVWAQTGGAVHLEPSQRQLALELVESLGGHQHDVVVDGDALASRCTLDQLVSDVHADRATPGSSSAW